LTERYAYFVRIHPPEFTVERPASLWRQAPGGWQFWSTIDWSWYGMPAEAADDPPPSSGLVRVAEQRATELASDRHGWVRYWALHRGTRPGSGWRSGAGADSPFAEPTTLVRRRLSPERQLDEVFGARNMWRPTDLVTRYERTGLPDAAGLVEIDRYAAELITHRLTGSRGAIEL
jgi:hypothetical protein